MHGGGSGKKPGIGERLKAARDRAGLSLRAAAAEIGLGVDTICQIGKGAVTGRKSLAKVEDWLAVKERRFAAEDAAAAAAEASGLASPPAPQWPPERLHQQVDGLLDRLEVELSLKAARSLREQRFAAIRRWLFAVTPQNPEQDAFVHYLRGLVGRLWAPNPAGLFWQAMKTLAPLAESEWWTRPWEVEVDLCRDEKQQLRKIRKDRWRCRVGDRRAPGVALRMELVAVTLKGLEICVRTRDLAGVDGCLELLAEVGKSVGVKGWRWQA